ncbi:MAG: hypothetical protein VX898_00645 [Candidatus Thermoplasmatota archaeon]|nr:hypothetical protein [Candidatus Thermoplasmatota archaeon]
MSNMNLPEWTAQAFVAAGAVFLLICAYVLGVMVPNGLLAPNDFEVNYYFEGDIETFDLDTENGTGVFVDNVGTGSFDPTKAEVEAGATLNLIGKPNGDYTRLLQNFSLTNNGIDGEGDWLGTIAESESLLHRKEYTINGTQGTWTPTNLPEEGKEYKFPNPVNGDYSDTFICSDKRTIDGVEVMTCSADETATQIPFMPGEGSALRLLKDTFEGRNGGAGPGSAPMWFSYKAEYIVGTEFGGVIDRIYNVTIYMALPTMVHLDDNNFEKGGFNFTTYYEGRVGGLNTFTFQSEYYDATGFRSGCVITDSSNTTDTHVNVLGYLRIFETEYDDNGTALPANYGVQSSDGCWDSSSKSGADSHEELVNVTYDVNRRTLQFVDGTVTYVDGVATPTVPGGDGFNFFAPVCETISLSKECWVPDADASWPNAMYNPHMQNYAFMGEVDWEGTFAGVAYHFRADEKNISGNEGALYQEVLQTGLDMDYYEDVWIDPITGTVLDQKYDIQISVPSGVPDFGNATLRDIVANYTEEQKDSSISGARLQALAQYYQGQEIFVLKLNGTYTEKTVNELIQGEKDKSASYELGTKTIPTIMVALAMISLIAGFFVYYQTGGAISDGGMGEPSSEVESSSSIATAEEESTKDEVADDSSDGESDTEEESDSEEDDEDDDDGRGGDGDNVHSVTEGGFG